MLGNYSRTLRGPIGRTLEHSPGWKLAFLDPLATVWIRARQRFSPRVDLRPRCLEGRVPFTLAAGRLRARWTERVQAVFLHDWPSNYLVEYLADLGELGRTADVEKLASRALPSSPRPALLLRQRCAARAVLGRLREALADCDRASALAPDDADIARLRRTVRERASQR